MTDVEDEIARYRRELAAAADLARGDIDELEDHLRSLYDDLRATGVPAAEAIAAAAQRLGDPRCVAREHARVRGTFGARISWVRAWAAALLLAPILVTGWRTAREVGLVSLFGWNAMLGTVMLAGLVARTTWGRAIVLVGCVHAICMNVMYGVESAALHSGFHVGKIAVFAGAAMLLSPWRRGEITRAGAALGLLTFAYSPADWLLGLLAHTPQDIPLASVAGPGFVLVVLAGVAMLARSRVAPLLAAASGLAIAVATAQRIALSFPFHQPHWIGAAYEVTFFVGVAAALASAYLAYRARLRQVPSAAR